MDSLPLLFRAANLIQDSFLITTARLDPPGPQVIYVNRGFTEMTGYSADEVIGRSPRFLQGPATSREVLDALKANLGRGEDFDGRLVNYRKDGSEYQVELRIRPIRSESSGEVTHFFSLQRDVSKETEVEAHLKRFEQAVHQTQDAIVMFGADGHVYFANQAYLDWSGITMEEALARPVWKLPGCPPSPEEFRWARRRLGQGEPWQREYDIALPGDGGWERRSVFTTVSPVRRKEGQDDFVAISRDITERNRLWSIAEAHRIASGMGEIFAFIRHELGNPINSMKSALTILESKSDPLSERQSGFVARILEEVSRLEWFIGSLRRLGLYDHVRSEPVDLGAVLDRLERVVSSEVEARALSLRIEPAAEKLTVVADGQALLHVLHEIVTNAMDAVTGRDGGSITIGHRAVGRRLRLWVRDDGVGIARHDLPLLTRPFFSRKEGSAGVGLALVGKILSRMGGTLDFESVAGEGTTVTLELDLEQRPSESGPSLRSERSAPSGRAKGVASRPKRARGTVGTPK